jgi:hypothetical protein
MAKKLVIDVDVSVVEGLPGVDVLRLELVLPDAAVGGVQLALDVIDARDLIPFDGVVEKEAVVRTARWHWWAFTLKGQTVRVRGTAEVVEG